MLVAVKVTVTDPPQAEGAPVLLFDKTELQPPVNVADASHVAKSSSMAVCDWQDALVTGAGEVSRTGVAELTLNVLVHEVV